MMKRCKHEIIADILKTCITAEKKKELLVKCSLNGKEAKEFLDMLVKNQLLAEIKLENYGVTIYMTTQKGIEYINILNRLEEMIK